MIVLLSILGALGSVLGAWWSYLSWKTRAGDAEEDAARRILEKLNVPPLVFAEIKVWELREAEAAMELLEFRDDRNVRSHGKVPSCVLLLFGTEDRLRYAWEWGAHLLQLIEEGEVKQARRDRRRLALAAVTLAITLRLCRAFRRARSRS